MDTLDRQLITILLAQGVRHGSFARIGFVAVSDRTSKGDYEGRGGPAM